MAPLKDPFVDVLPFLLRRIGGAWTGDVLPDLEGRPPEREAVIECLGDTCTLGGKCIASVPGAGESTGLETFRLPLPS